MAINQYEFPVDLPDSEREDGHRHAHALTWTTIVIAVATVLLALFNAQSLSEWTEELDPSPTAAIALDHAERWKATTDQVGLSAPRTRLHRVWKTMEAARWPGQDEPVTE